MDLLLRPVAGEEELLPFQRAVAAGFHEIRPHDRLSEMLRTHLDRTVVALDGDEIVGTGVNYSLTLVVPGGRAVPMAGVSAISTRPTHTRRGVLRAVMAYLTADAQQHGEPLMGLTASEHTIYGRFGYGVATKGAIFEIERRRTALRRPPRAPGRLRLLDEDSARALLPPAYERVMAAWPGAVSRPAAWWSDDYFDDPDDTDAWFYVVHEDPAGQVDGYVTYTVKRSWEGGVPRGRAEVAELVAADAEVRFALFDHLLRLDLVDTVRTGFLAADDPVQLLLTDARRMRIVEHRDRLWLRLLDVPACLAARTYSADGEVVLEVDDPDGHAAGRFELVVEGGAGTCRPCRRTADLAVSVVDLSAAFLGGVRWSALAVTGLATELAPGAAARADALFSIDPAPTTVSWF